MRNARIKHKSFSSHFKSTVEELGLVEIRNKLNNAPIQLKLVKNRTKEDTSPILTNDDNDVDWDVIKQHYKDVKRYKHILAVISATNKITAAIEKLCIYDYFFSDEEYEEFMELLNKASNKFLKLNRYCTEIIAI